MITQSTPNAAPSTSPDLSSIMAKYNYAPPVASKAAAGNGGGWYSKLNPTTPTTTPAPKLGEDPAGVGDYAAGAIKSQFDSGVTQVKNSYEQAKNATNPLEKTEAGMGMLAGGIGAVTAPIIAPVVKPIGDIVQWLGDKIGSTKLAQDFVKNHPDAASALERIATDAGNTSVVLGTVMGAPELAKGMPATISRLKSAASDIADTSSAIYDHINKSIESPSMGVNADTPAFLDQVKAKLGGSNVDPRLEASANRLQDPVGTYKDYATQAENAVKDVKADPPLAKVGEHIGNSFDQVVKLRQNVGATMADELTKVKDTPVDIGNSFNKFEEELNKSGLQYDAEAKKFIPNKQSKMTSFDQELVTNYVQELNKLGANPTAGEMDAFLSRVPNELDVTKAAKNITDVTNAERLIKGNLKELSNNLTKQPGLEGYAKARTAYANLSDFLDEGSKYLRAKTQSGDYARDTSLAKSSAESILNGGKKDWLNKLESLTGYKALDDATLAIQAMKDAGDIRGLSLFKSLAGGGMPTPHGLLGKVMNWGMNKAADTFVGTPAEQTQAFLESLGINKEMPQSTPMTNTAGQKPANIQTSAKSNASSKSMPNSVEPKGSKSNGNKTP